MSLLADCMAVYSSGITNYPVPNAVNSICLMVVQPRSISLLAYPVAVYTSTVSLLLYPVVVSTYVTSSDID